MSWESRVAHILKIGNA